MNDRPAAVECTRCGHRAEFPEVTLSDLHKEARSLGYSGQLNAARDALVSLCPDCNPNHDSATS